MSTALHVREQAGHKPRCVALFPGAFRPPHAAHLHAVLDLRARADIDEIVIIISNRCRSIPGTHLALAPDVALAIWNIYLQDIDHVRVEIAPHTAVQHALDYFNRLERGDRLLFCIGENDFANGDPRFSKLDSLVELTGISARVIPAPTGALQIRATPLRAALAQGEPGRQLFVSALPDRLTDTQRLQIWQLCQDRLQDISHIIEQKVRSLIDKHDLGEITALSRAGRSKLDQVFRVRFTDGRQHYIKYAGDTVDGGSLGQNFRHKPRRRVSTERRTLNRLRDYGLDSVALPDMVLFDKSVWSTVLTEVCPGGVSLQQQLMNGIFDPEVIATVCHFLAGCHTAPDQLAPVWGEETTDRQHWQRMLMLRTTALVTDDLPGSLHVSLQQLHDASLEAEQRHLFLLDLRPKHIRINPQQTGITNLELGSSWGDPAFDLGLLLGQYLLFGFASHASDSCRRAIEQALNSYRARVGNLWLTMRSRVTAFAGAGLLSGATDASTTNQHDNNATIRLADRLLVSGVADNKASLSELLDA